MEVSAVADPMRICNTRFHPRSSCRGGGETRANLRHKFLFPIPQGVCRLILGSSDVAGGGLVVVVHVCFRFVQWLIFLNILFSGRGGGLWVGVLGVLQRFFAALVLCDLVNECPMAQAEAKYKVPPGQSQWLYGQ